MDYESWLKELKYSNDESVEIEIDKIHSFSYKINNDLISKDNVDLCNQKALERYNKFIKLIINKPIIMYTQEHFNKIKYEECILIFKNIIYDLLGNNKYINTILKNFISIIEINNSQDPLDGTVLQYEIINNENIVNKKYRVIIPGCNTTGSIVCLVHEFIHYISFIQGISINKKPYYYEILSIFAEKYATRYLKGQGRDTEESKIDSIRLSNLKYQNTTIKKQIDDYRLLAQRENDENMYNFYKEYRIFYKLLSESYGLGYLYSTTMLELYLNDNSFKIDFNRLFNKDITLQELLDKYSINMDNKDVIELSKRRIRQIIK